jgi:hypothetical protein
MGEAMSNVVSGVIFGAVVIIVRIIRSDDFQGGVGRGIFWVAMFAAFAFITAGMLQLAGFVHYDPVRALILGLSTI